MTKPPPDPAEVNHTLVVGRLRQLLQLAEAANKRILCDWLTHLIVQVIRARNPREQNPKRN